MTKKALTFTAFLMLLLSAGTAMAERFDGPFPTPTGPQPPIPVLGAAK